MASKKAARRRTPASAPCPKCGRFFSRNDSLNRHLKTHTSHIDQRPFHRILSNEKFRACKNCRRLKTRCTGSLPCSRCEQSGVNCHYGQKPDDQQPASATSPSVTPQPSEPRRTLSNTHAQAGPSRRATLDVEEPVVDPVLTAPENISLDAVKSPEGTVDAMPGPSPESTTAMLRLSLDADADARALLFNDDKEFPIIQSTYVSPTMYILDPYSYKLPSLADSREAPTPSSQPLAHCRYAVLQYLSPFMDREFSSNLACDLLDTYFSSAFSSRMHPTCYHIHNFILRKCDVLDPVHPRKTHPALLGSMLFVAALSDKALGLFSGPEERDRVCKYLSLLTYRLLNPSRYEPLLNQEDLGLPPAFPSDIGWTNDDLLRAFDPQQLTDGLPVAWGTDYIIALIHVSSVISGSEKKAASIRWWSVAFNLARDLKLNQEVESFIMPQDHGDAHPNVNCKCSLGQDASEDLIGEVHREERRRTWYMLYLMDRHLALCYNHSLTLLEAECKDLLLPLDDVTWQSGIQPHSHGTRADGPRCMLLPAGTGRLHGPPRTCSGPGLFEFFLPLMTITGHLLDYNRAKSNPVLASAGSTMWISQERRILQELDQYQESLERLTITPAREAASEKGSPWTTSPAALTDDVEANHIINTFSAYATHICFVLKILVGSKWDPVSLFNDDDFFTSSESFKSSMSHTMMAAQCVTQIIEHDPDVSFMPYFFGIQLLHGSLLLLLVAYRLQADSGTAILAACEAVIRATEACFVTLPTDYQRQFRNVMRSAIALAKGRRNNPSDTEKQLTFVLARYRWSRNGAGLAR